MIQLIGVKGDCHINIREKFTIVDSKLTKALNSVSAVVAGVVIVSTCNRTEIYVDSIILGDELIEVIFESLAWDKAFKNNIFYVKGKHAARHLMEVACGFHSKILGEDQILGQIRQGYNKAVECKTVNGSLHKLFQSSIGCGKSFRENSQINKVPVSSASIVAREAINRRFKRIMLIGFGNIGKLVLKYLGNVDLDKLYIVVRDTNKISEELKKNFNISFVNYEESRKLYIDVQCIISCTAAPHPIVYKKDLPIKEFFIYDLALPRDVEIEVNTMKDVKVFDIDNISKIDEKNKIKRKTIMKEHRYIIEKNMDDFGKWLKLNELSPEIKKFKNVAEAVCLKRTNDFKHKRYTKNIDTLAETLIHSTAKVYVNRAIEVLKEEKLEGREEECLRILKKIFLQEN